MSSDQRGLSLVELMVAIAIASFIALAGITLYVTTVGAGKDLYDQASQTEQIFCNQPVRCPPISGEQGIAATPPHSARIW